MTGMAVLRLFDQLSAIVTGLHRVMSAVTGGAGGRTSRQSARTSRFERWLSPWPSPWLGTPETHRQDWQPGRSPFGNQLSGSKVWHANVFNVHSRRNRDSRLTTTPPRQMYYPHYLEHAMRRVTAREANQRFSEVLSAVETGEQVVITKRGRPVALMSPYPAEALAAERQAAIDRMIASMNEPVILRGGFRTFTRDEMHEC